MNRDSKEPREVLLGRYLSEWVDDLRNGKSPQVGPRALEDLSEDELRELLATARFTKAVSYPAEETLGESDAIRARLQQTLYEVRERQLVHGRALVASSTDFGQCLREARTSLGLSTDDIARGCAIPASLLEDVEQGRRPPIRVSVAKMTNLLQRLYIAVEEAAELINTSTERWARQTYPRIQEQLGRTGKEKSEAQRRTLMEGAGIQEVGGSLERELDRSKEYVAALRVALGKAARGEP